MLYLIKRYEKWNVATEQEFDDYVAAIMNSANCLEISSLNEYIFQTTLVVEKGFDIYRLSGLEPTIAKLDLETNTWQTDQKNTLYKNYRKWNRIEKRSNSVFVLVE